MSRGFTLVELAVVMTVIGLLIGGILKGQELINQARITATVKQVNSVMAAQQGFIDKYGQMPGDMSTAETRLSGCTAVNFCQNGEGNGIIGTTMWNGDVPTSPSQEGVNTLPEVEAAMFWKHMALADLITGIDPGGDPLDPTWGVTHLNSHWQGGFLVAYSVRTGDVGRGHLLVLRRRIKRGLFSPGKYVLSPVHAGAIDRKMDDGFSNGGWIQSDPKGGAPDTPYPYCDDNDGNYVASFDLRCIMFYQIKY